MRTRSSIPRPGRRRVPKPVSPAAWAASILQCPTDRRANRVGATRTGSAGASGERRCPSPYRRGHGRPREPVGSSMRSGRPVWSWSRRWPSSYPRMRRRMAIPALRPAIPRAGWCLVSPCPTSSCGSASGSGVRTRSPRPTSSSAPAPSTRAPAWTCRPDRRRIRRRSGRSSPRAARRSVQAHCGALSTPRLVYALRQTAVANML